MAKTTQKYFLLIICLTGLSGLARAGEAVKLFDGKTFAGWEGNRQSFRIEQGAVVGGSLKEKVPRNEFLCTKKTYKNFILTLEVKLLGGPKANAGIQIRTKRIPNHHEVSGYQADMGVGWWGSLYDESRRNKVLARADAAAIQKTLKPGDWNRYKIHCEGRRIRALHQRYADRGLHRARSEYPAGGGNCAADSWRTAERGMVPGYYPHGTALIHP